MRFEPTVEQSRAIYSKENTLVSAAAGSGKTAVLVHRVIEKFKDTENKLMADRVLIVTFTNAAAAELKLRIERMLDEEIGNDPDNEHLRQQKMLLPAAQICTIDSFCISFVRDNFERAGVVPSFKMADNADARMLLSASLIKLMNDEFNSGNNEFLQILDFVGAVYDEKNLSDCIKSIFEYSRKMPYPDKWIEWVVKNYEDFAYGKSDAWFLEGIELYRKYVDEVLNIITKALEVLELNEAAYEKYSESIIYIYDFILNMQSLCDLGDWDKIYSAVSDFAPPAFKRLSSDLKDANSEYAAEMKKKAVDLFKKGNKLIYGTKEMLRLEIMDSLGYLRKMAELTVKLSKIYGDELRSRGLLTFDMVEQMALEIISEYRDGEILPSDDAGIFCGLFDEVLVDEYQDTNNLQDTLFSILSDNERKLFCVGDAKQSIYRFRGANPLNFIEKKKYYKSADEGERRGLRIDLSGNFRSRKGICDYVNRLFSLIMHEEYAQIEYDSREALIPLAKFPESNAPEVEKYFIDFENFDDNYDLTGSGRIRATKAEGHFIARKILSVLEEPPFIKDGDTLRKARLSDIVILLRTGDVGGTFSRILKEYGIGTVVSSNSLLDTDEVATLLSILKVINNPYDDVALLTALTSPVFGFTINEIAEIRGSGKREFLMASLTRSAKTNQKVSDFLKFIRQAEEVSIVSKISNVIDFIFETTNFTGIVSRLHDGENKKSALMTIRNFAASFEAEGKRTLREFLKAIDGMIDKDFNPDIPYSKNSVRITTIHSSKGLQYPVCILADIEHNFNFLDTRKPQIQNEKHGFSFKYYDEDATDSSETLLRVLMSEYEKNAILAEEVRLLYVALTRAEDRLIITASVPDLKKKIEPLMNFDFVSDGRMREFVFRQSKCYSDLIFADEFLHSADDYIAYFNSDTPCSSVVTVLPEVSAPSEERAVADDRLVAELGSLYCEEYPYSELLSIESKASVTSVVHKADALKFQFSTRPAFMHEGGLTATEKGTATHAFMQYADYGAAKVSVEAEAEKLYEAGFLTYEQFKAVDENAVMTFFNGALAGRIAKAADIRREMNFLTEFPAAELHPEVADRLADEKIIVQGAVDLLFVEEGKIVIVDFKTDRNKDEDELKAAYAEQLRIYGRACEDILKMPVSELYIYSFTLGKAIKC